MLASVSIVLRCPPFIALWAFALALAPPAPPLPAGAPVSAAVTVHTDLGDRLAIAELAKGTYEVVGSASAADPVWSPNGRWLIYREGPVVFLMQVGDRRGKRLLQGIGTSGSGVYSFSPDSRLLAVATTAAVEFWSIESDSPRRVASATTKLRLRDLTWSTDGKRAAACGWNGREAAESRESIQAFELAADTVSTRVLQRTARSCRLLGMRQGKWLVKRSATDRIEELVAVGDDGKAERLLRVPEYRHADRYLIALDGVLLVHEAEDTGDPTQIDLAPLTGGGRPRPWLRKWKRLAEYSLSADGKYVLFTQLSSEGALKGGDIYLATTEGQDPRRVLPGPASKRATFSQPAPKPSP